MEICLADCVKNNEVSLTVKETGISYILQKEGRL